MKKAVTLFQEKLSRKNQGRETEMLMEANEKLRRELRRVQRDYQDLEGFIAWLNKKSINDKSRIYGIKRQPLDAADTYVGFLLSAKLSVVPERTYDYCIEGYTMYNRDEPVYRAMFQQQLSDIPTMENRLHLEETYVKGDYMQNRGIGSAGIDMIKDLAKHLHCTSIIAKRTVMRNTVSNEQKQAELQKLIHFYDKNGFSQTNGSEYIEFDMSNYKTPQNK